MCRESAKGFREGGASEEDADQTDRENEGVIQYRDYPVVPDLKRNKMASGPYLGRWVQGAGPGG
jgi:hypothetical protein